MGPPPPRGSRVVAVTREGHRGALGAARLNREQAGLGHLLATAGSGFATVYDCRRFGNSGGVVLQLQCASGPAGRPSVAWVSAHGLSDHPYGDAWLAVGGAEEEAVEVVSTVAAEVVALLPGHTGGVLALTSCGALPGVLVALCPGGLVRIWFLGRDARGGRLSELRVGENCTTVAVRTRGGGRGAGAGEGEVLTGHENGAIRAWDFGEGGSREPRLLVPGTSQGLCDIDALRCSEGVLANFRNGRFVVYGPDGAECSRWRVPQSMGLRCSFGLTEDEGFVCCGDSLGELHLFETATGKRAFSLGPYRLSKPVAACQVRDGCAEAYAVLGDGFIFQWAVPKTEHEPEHEPQPQPEGEHEPEPVPEPELEREHEPGLAARPAP